MMLRRILISMLPRESRPRLSYSPNLFNSRPSPRPLVFAATALAFSTAVSLIHLDSDTSRDKETTVGRHLL
jgi:hypothetical protein